MPENVKNWIAIPVFNHSSKLKALTAESLALCPNIVVIDDGSTDQDIRKLLSETGIKVLSHQKNMGKGEAIRSAAKFICEKGGENMITLDADGQHSPADIMKFADAISRGGGRLILGTRDFNSGKIPLASRTGRKISNFLVWLETGWKLKDTQSGFRSYPVEILKNIDCSSSRFAFETEIIVKALWKGYEVEELDISVSYPVGKERISHFRFLKDNLRILFLHTKLLSWKIFKGSVEGRK